MSAAGIGGHTGDKRQLAEHIGKVLELLESRGDLAISPLLAAPHTPTVPALRKWLREAAEALAASTATADADAGQVLLGYYFRRASTHQTVAHRLHLSRATYFRRLQRGVNTLADWFQLGTYPGQREHAR